MKVFTPINQSTNLPNLGENIKRLRNEQSLSIIKLAEQSGIPQSTLSKVENGQMSLNYNKLLSIAKAFSVDIEDLFQTSESLRSSRAVMARRSINYKKEGTSIAVDHYLAKFLSTEIKNRLMIPLLLEIKSTNNEDDIHMMDLVGERFAYVVEGPVNFHCEHYETTILESGDAIYVDASMPHGFSCDDGKTAKVITVLTSDNSKYLEKVRLASIKGETNVSDTIPR